MTKHIYPLSLKHCRIIRALAQYSNEASASESLNTSKSNISRNLKSAEESLGCKLFYRDRGGFLPTREGFIVISHCGLVLREIETVEKQLSIPETKGSLLTPYLEWRHLEAISATVNFSTVSSAAHELGLTQSAVSRTLTSLEHMARQKLFKRRSHSLEALSSARALALLYRKIETQINGLLPALAVAPGALTGRVFVGILPFISDEIVARAIGLISQKHPHVQLQPIQAPFQMLAHSLRSGEIDCLFGLMREPDVFSDLTEVPLFKSRYSLVARADHAAHKSAKKLEDLMDEQWIMAPHGAPARRYLESLLLDLGLNTPTRTMETIAFNIIEQVLVHSDAISLVVYQEGRSAPLDPRLKVIDIDLPNPECTIGLLLLKGDIPEAVEQFKEIIQGISPID